MIRLSLFAAALLVIHAAQASAENEDPGSKEKVTAETLQAKIDLEKKRLALIEEQEKTLKKKIAVQGAAFDLAEKRLEALNKSNELLSTRVPSGKIRVLNARVARSRIPDAAIQAMNSGACTVELNGAEERLCCEATAFLAYHCDGKVACEKPPTRDMCLLPDTNGRPLIAFAEYQCDDSEIKPIRLEFEIKDGAITNPPNFFLACY